MRTSLRITAVLMLALAASLSLHAASAQMMHFTLNVVVETADGAPIPAGQVCVSGEVDDICQDIPADSPSGKEFAFSGLADGEHDVSVSAEPYLEAVDHPTLTENETTITMTLQMEDTAPPADDVLPDTGVGSTAEASAAATSLMMLVTSGLAFGLLSLAFVQRRQGR